MTTKVLWVVWAVLLLLLPVPVAQAQTEDAECVVDSDCPEGGGVCDPESGKCTAFEQAPNPGLPTCDQCGCDAAADTACWQDFAETSCGAVAKGAGAPACDPAYPANVACLTDADCGPGLVCDVADAADPEGHGCVALGERAAPWGALLLSQCHCGSTPWLWVWNDIGGGGWTTCSAYNMGPGTSQCWVPSSAYIYTPSLWSIEPALQDVRPDGVSVMFCSTALDLLSPPETFQIRVATDHNMGNLVPANITAVPSSAPAWGWPWQWAWNWESGSCSPQKYRVRGLQPDQRYFYQVVYWPYGQGGAGQGSQIGTFMTSQAPGTRSGFSFLVYGDTRGHSGHDPQTSLEHQTVVDWILNGAGGLRFSVATGDYTKGGRFYGSWYARAAWSFFGAERMLMRDVPVLPSYGNHEFTAKNYVDFSNLFVGQYSYQTIWDDVFVAPQDAPEFSWYGTTFGNVYIAVLNSEQRMKKGSPQYDWLKWTLATYKADPNIDHIFLVMHSGLYSAGKHGDCNRQKKKWFQGQGTCDNIQELLEAAAPKAKAVFAGHDHQYARMSKNGIIHILQGAGGAPLGATCEWSKSGASVQVCNKDTHSYTRVDVCASSPSQGSRIRMRTYSAPYNNVIDDVSIGALPPGWGSPGVTDGCGQSCQQSSCQANQCGWVPNGCGGYMDCGPCQTCEGQCQGGIYPDGEYKLPPGECCDPTLPNTCPDGQVCVPVAY
jgi:hypothetical protein